MNLQKVKRITRVSVLLAACIACFYLSFKSPVFLSDTAGVRSQCFRPEWFFGGVLLSFMLITDFDWKYKERKAKGE